MKAPQDTLRYKNMVANLKSRPAHVKEAALLKEIAKGSQWRIDAVLESITKAGEWADISHAQILNHAAMFGRLATVKSICGTLQYKKNILSAPAGVIDAFHTAVLHGHYRVADYMHALGAKPGYEPKGARFSPYFAVKHGDLRKIDYLLAKEGDAAESKSLASYLVQFAVPAANMKVIKHLFDKGADVSDDAFLTAIKYGRKGLALEFLSRGFDLSKASCSDEAVYSAVGDGDAKFVKILLEAGGKVPFPALDSAFCKGNMEIAELLLPHVSNINDYRQNQNAVVSAAFSPKSEEAIALCLKHGGNVASALAMLKSEKRPLWERRRGEEKAIAVLEKHLAAQQTPPKQQPPKP